MRRPHDHVICSRATARRSREHFTVTITANCPRAPQPRVRAQFRYCVQTRTRPIGAAPGSGTGDSNPRGASRVRLCELSAASTAAGRWSPREDEARGRPPIACGRPCSRSSATWRVRACSICSPDRAHSRSKRSRAGRRRRRLSTARRPLFRPRRRNLEALGLEAEVRRQAVMPFLRNAAVQQRQYDLVFLDPPYRHPSRLAEELGAALEPVLAPGARVVSESDRRAPLRRRSRRSTHSQSASTATP